MVECQPSTPIWVAKSHETMLCTDTKTGRTNADSSIPATAWSFHCLGVPLQPRHMTPYTLLTRPPVRSLRTARSGSRATKTKSVLAVRYVITALGSPYEGRADVRPHPPRKVVREDPERGAPRTPDVHQRRGHQSGCQREDRQHLGGPA